MCLNTFFVHSNIFHNLRVMCSWWWRKHYLNKNWVHEKTQKIDLLILIAYLSKCHTFLPGVTSISITTIILLFLTNQFTSIFFDLLNTWYVISKVTNKTYSQKKLCKKLDCILRHKSCEIWNIFCRMKSNYVWVWVQEF